MEKVNLSKRYLTIEQEEQRDKIIDELNGAFNDRSLPYTELDDMTYDQWYLANKKAASGYVKPRRNREDLRIVTGSTREKVNTVVTALLKYKFDFRIDAFDKKDWPNRDVGFGIEGLVRKSRELEEPVYEKKRALIYNEYVSQGNAFLYEMTIHERKLRKVMDGNSMEDVLKMKWTEKHEVNARCDIDLVPGTNVYLGNIREYYMEKQPFIGIRRELPKCEMKQMYGKWERWKYADTPENQVLNDVGDTEYNSWQMLKTEEDYMEEIRYFNVHTNTYQILLNGVPMLPVGFPLEYLLGVNRYPIIKVDGEPISRFFAYCRGIATKNKFNQSVLDEFYRIITLKFRKSTNPPVSNMTGRILNKSIFTPGTVHFGVDGDKIKPIGQNDPVSGPEFETFQLVKQAIDESSVSPIMEGVRTPGEQTAQEINTLKTQALQKLGMIMVGVIQMEEEMVWLRAYNILRHWTAPIDVTLEDVKGQIKEKKKYRSESVESSFDDGMSGIQMIEMAEEPLPDERQVFAEETFLSRKKGVEVRKVYLNAKELASLKYKLKVTVNPVEKDANELRAALFEESVTKALTMFPESVNKEYVQQEWANHQKLDPRKLFVKGSPNTPPLGQEMNEGGPTGSATLPAGAKTVGGQISPQISQKMKPNLKRMM